MYNLVLLCWISLIFQQVDHCSPRPPGIVYRVVREYAPDSYSSTSVKRSDDDGNNDEDEVKDLASFVTRSSRSNDYSEYGRRLKSPPKSTLYKSNNGNDTRNNKKEKRSSSKNGEQERHKKKGYDDEEEDQEKHGEEENHNLNDDDSDDNNRSGTSWQDEFKPDTIENEFRSNNNNFGEDEDSSDYKRKRKERIPNSDNMRHEGEELYPSIITGINPDHERKHHQHRDHFNGFQMHSPSTLLDDEVTSSYETLTPRSELSSPSPLLAPPLDSTESIDPIRLISAGNGTFIESRTYPNIEESSEEWTTSLSPTMTSTSSPQVRRGHEKYQNYQEPDEDYEEEVDHPLDPRHVGEDQYHKSRLIKRPKVKQYHRKEVTRSPTGSSFRESHHVTKELLPRESERDSVLDDEGDDDEHDHDYDSVGHNYPSTAGSHGYSDHDDDETDTYQPVGDGENDGSSYGGGIYGHSDTYPYEEEDKDDVSHDDDDDKDTDHDGETDDDDSMLESKSEVYVQSGTDNIPNDLRKSTEIIDHPVDSKEAEADMFMKNREMESDRIFGNLQHSQVIKSSR